MVKLGQGIDWEVFDQKFGKHYAAKVGRPATRTRLIVGLTYLQFMYDMSDEAVVERWVESPYWQHFTGEEYFQHDFPLHPTTLVKWRRKIAEEGCEWLMTQTLQAGKKLGVLKTSSLDKVVMDKVYAIHAPKVACIAKGKARNPYEFGAKVSIAVTAKDSWVVGARTFKGNPYDSHTLFEASDQIKSITDHTPKQVYVDRGYQAAYLGQQTDVIITGQKRHSKATSGG